MANSYDAYVGQFKWINHQDKEILFLKFEGGYESDALHWLGLFIEELSKKEEGSVLLFASLANSAYSPRLALEWQKHQYLLHSKCSKVVIHGTRGIISIAVDTFLKVAKASGLEIGSKVRTFNDMDLAKDWLVEEAEMDGLLESGDKK